MTDIRLEVWDRLGTAGFSRKIDGSLDTITDSARLQPVNGIGEGKASLPDSFSRLAEILTVDPVTPANNVRSVIRAYLDGDVSGVDPPYVEWLPDQVIPPPESESGSFEISGLGRESMIRDAVVEPWDWDGSVDFRSTWPDWVYGGREIVGPLETTYTPHIGSFWIDAGATGTATIDIDLDGGGFQSATVAPGDSAFTVEQAIEALAYGITADVQGSGTITNPWQVKLLSPVGTYTFAINSAGLSGGRIYFNLDQFGDLQPVGWTESRVGSTTIGHGILTEWGASLGVTDDEFPVAVPAGCSAWVWFSGQEFYFPGVQKIGRVTPGGVYTLPPVYLYAIGASALVRVVVRDLNENLLAYEEITIPSNTLTQTTGVWSGPAVIGGTGSVIQIPEGVHEIVYRLGHIGAGTPPKIGLACPSMMEGFPASTIGVIVGDLYADWTTNHAASAFPLSYWVHGDGGFYLGLDFDGALDSAGNAWPREESITIKRGERFDRVLAKIVGLGYEWRVVPGPVDGYYLLQIFTAPTLGVHYETLDTPTIRGGRDVTRRALRRWLAKTGTLVEGANQFFSHAADAGARAGWGVSSDYQVRLDFEPAPTAVAAIERVSEQLRKTRSVVVTLADIGEPTVPIPGRDYVPGDTLRVLDPPTIVDDPERVWSINYARDESGLSWEVQLGNQSFSDAGGNAGAGAGRGAGVATTQAVRYLMEQQELVRAPQPEPLPTPITSPASTMPTVTFAAANSIPMDKEKSDFICPGADDAAFVRSHVLAIAASSPLPGRVVMLSGDYDWPVDPAVGYGIRLPPGWVMEGQTGYGPYASGPYLVGWSLTGTPGANDALILADQSVTIKGLALDGGGYDIDAIRVTGGVANIVITDCYIERSSGIWVTSNEIWIQRNVIQFNTTAITLDTVEQALVSDNHFSDNESHDIVIQGGGTRITLRSNTHVNTGHHAVYMTGTVGPEETWIIDNSITTPGFEVTGGSGIVSDQTNLTQRIWIISNEIEVPDLDCIQLKDYQYAIVAFNGLKEAFRAAISLADCSNCLVFGNVLLDYEDIGVILDGDSNENYLSHNILRSIAGPTFGIRVDDATCDDNIVIANDLRGAGGTEYSDAGTGTLNTWPAGAAGDNFV